MHQLLPLLVIFLVGVNSQDPVQAPEQTQPLTLASPDPVAAPDQVNTPVAAVPAPNQLNAPAEAVPAPNQLNAPAAAAPGAQPMATGEVTEHRSPDGSIITITKFNGNLPPQVLQPYAQAFWQPYEMQRQMLETSRLQQEAMLNYQNAMFSNTLYNLYNNDPYNFNYLTAGGFNPYYQPFYNPFFWPYGEMQMTGQQPQPNAPIVQPATGTAEKRSRRATDAVEKPYISTLPKRPRHSPVFHFPATVEDYWKMHKRPEVPVVEINEVK